MRKVKDMTGLAFSRLKVLYFSHSDSNGHPHWACLCECGTSRIVRGSKLRNGETKSCGCMRWKSSTRRVGTKLYNLWKAMRQRCQNSNAKDWKSYGGRGIVVCERWQNFANFLADMGKPRPGLSIDRVDNDGNYEPSNCRWATPKEQSNNRRNVKRLQAAT